MITHQPLIERDVRELPDGGRVAYCGHFGDDLDVVNVAYVSTNKFADELDEERHGGFIPWLAENGHTSPFRHQHLRFRIRCPIFVARQWMKHTVGCGWNERSARYVPFRADSDDVWAPGSWRKDSSKIKQGSLGPMDEDAQIAANMTYYGAVEASLKAYDDLLKMGVCREQARVVLPVGMMTELIWTTSLQALLHFLKLRCDAHAQEETRIYAEAIKDMVSHLPGRVFEHALATLDETPDE